jgi:hypothetical protein
MSISIKSTICGKSINMGDKYRFKNSVKSNKERFQNTRPINSMKDGKNRIGKRITKRK